MILDKDERRINHAFSQIRVDADALNRKVRDNMDKNRIVTHAPQKRIGFFVAATLILAIMLAGTAYAAVSMGVFERFFSQHETPFAEIVDPVEEYVVEDGIRVTLIAAQKFDSQAIVYLSLQDESGQNRITTDTTLSANWMEFGSLEMIYFNAATNTAYFEFALAAGEAVSSIELGTIFVIYTGHTDMSTTSLDMPTVAQDTIPLPNILAAEYSLSAHHTQLLAPSRGELFAGIGYTDGNHFISNMGVINGYLHVQVGTRVMPPRGLSGSFDGGRAIMPVLTTPSGEMSMERVYYNSYLSGWLNPTWARTVANFMTDENLQPLSAQDFENAQYFFLEYIFPVNVDELDQYTLSLEGTIFPDGINIDTGMRITAGDSTQIRSLHGISVAVETAIVNSVILNPLGVRFAGEFEDAGYDVSGPFALRSFSFGAEVVLETTEGNVYLGQAHTRIPAMPLTTFTSLARAEAPIDIDTVTAVIVDGVRIPLS